MRKISFINAQNTAIIIFFIGVYGLCARRNIIKTIISLGIMGGGVILFFLSVNRTAQSMPPIFTEEVAVAADPLPQALVITAIVVGISVTAVALVMFIAMYHKFGTTNWLKAMKHRKDIGI
ncbi:MAG TPA: cation:proton antiporter subunit C [Clostridia bacterium]|nr:cation:proton antiporter subunit C [Clostridia bacterium]HPQ46535.1 cation:proton antiporter subunit C [Clostridia bacterium]HRX42435.1 cation:proton antiporter subunit C [Clostridia bacterium]